LTHKPASPLLQVNSVLEHEFWHGILHIAHNFVLTHIKLPLRTKLS